MSGTRRVRCPARLALAEGVAFGCERTAGHDGPHEYRGLVGLLNAFAIKWADLLAPRNISRSMQGDSRGKRWRRGKLR